MSQAHSSQAQYVTSGDPETVNDSDAKVMAPGQLGKYITIKRPGPAGTAAGSPEDYRDHTYRYVIADSTMSTAPYPGAVAWWSDKSRFKVTTSPTATARGLIAGVFKNSYSPLGGRIFIQTSGPSTVKFVDAPTAAIAVGVSVIPSATAGKADTTAAGTAPPYPTLGIIAGIPNSSGVVAASGNPANATWVVDLFIPEQP